MRPTTVNYTRNYCTVQTLVFIYSNLIVGPLLFENENGEDVIVISMRWNSMVVSLPDLKTTIWFDFIKTDNLPHTQHPVNVQKCSPNATSRSFVAPIGSLVYFTLQNCGSVLNFSFMRHTWVHTIYVSILKQGIQMNIQWHSIKHHTTGNTFPSS